MTAREIKQALADLMGVDPPRSIMERKMMLACFANIATAIDELPKRERAKLRITIYSS